MNADQGIGCNNNGLSDKAARKLITLVEYYFSIYVCAILLWIGSLELTHEAVMVEGRPLFSCIMVSLLPISVVASFKMIKPLISSISQLAAVLRNSTKLAVSEDGKKVKRLHPVTRCGIEERQACIVVVGNLPKRHCHRNLRLAFSFVGSVKSIRTCQPRLSNNGASSTFRSSKTDNYPAYNELIRRKASNRRIGHKQSSWGLAENDGEVNCEDVSVSASEQNQTWEQNQTETIFSELDAYPMKD